MTREHQLLVAAKVWRLTARTLAAEVDHAFYQALLGLAYAPGLRAKGMCALDPQTLVLPAGDALIVLAAEYRRLFAGPDPACPPYPSVHSGLRQPVSTLETILHRYHLAVAGDRLDHASVAFTLLDQLYSTAAGHPAAPLGPVQAADAARDIVDSYLPAWAPRFLHQLRAQARLAPYRPVAAMAAALLGGRPPDPRPPTETTMITVYSTPSCGFCHRLKAQLDREGIPYTDINIEQDEQAAAYVASVNNGNHVVPTVRCPGGATMTNPTIGQVKDCLALTLT